MKNIYKRISIRLKKKYKKMSKIRASIKSKTAKTLIKDEKLENLSNILKSPPPQMKKFTDEFSNNYNKIISKTPIISEKQFRRLSDSEFLNSNNLSMNILLKQYEKYPIGEIIKLKSTTTIKSISYNSYHGLIKEDNEDRISIKSLIKKPNNSKFRVWPKMSYFAIFDGHGGELCSSFLKKNFLNYLIEDKNFPNDIKESLLNTIKKIEKEFNNKYVDILNNNIDFSGSCALILLIIENKIYIANVGDSRAIISLNQGNKIYPLTIDHKPNNPKEFERIIKIGGKVYIDQDDDERDINKLKVINNLSDFDKYLEEPNIIYRIYPCHLAVSRTIGDIKAKDTSYGGIHNQIISIPDIYIVDINSNMDFIIMGCDGIFDNLSNSEIIDCAWFAVDNVAKDRKYDINFITLDICNMVIKNAMDKLSSDNLSVIVIGLEGLEKYIANKKNKDSKDKINSINNDIKKK